MNGPILVIDGDLPLCETLRMACSALRYEFFCAPDEKSALDLLAARTYGAVLCDSRLLTGEAKEPSHDLRQLLRGALLILTSDQKMEALAHDALRYDAFATLPKPTSLPEVTLTLRRASQFQRAHRVRESLRRELQRNALHWPIVAASDPMIAFLEDLERAADSEAHVLLKAEPGTEKHAIARMIHAQSARRGEPFMVVDCSRTAPEDLDRELFGDEHNPLPTARGRRVGALADVDGGLVFLDRVDTLAEGLQAKLAALLSPTGRLKGPQSTSPKRDFRLIAAVSPPCAESEAPTRLTADLERLLGGMPLCIPALRERPRDIPLLGDHFLRTFGRSCQKPDLSFRDRTLEHLISYPWPGNIRELENLVERLAIVAPNGPIGPRLLPEAIRQEVGLSGPAPSGSYLRYTRRCAEISAIEQALLTTQGNRTHAARRLGISHRSLLYKIKEYGLGN